MTITTPVVGASGKSPPVTQSLPAPPSRWRRATQSFGTPGLGNAMFTAVNERDVFVMQNLVFLYAVVFVLLNILVDIIIAGLDPRIRLR